jgi:hypothetical protein
MDYFIDINMNNSNKVLEHYFKMKKYISLRDYILFYILNLKNSNFNDIIEFDILYDLNNNLNIDFNE